MRCFLLLVDHFLRIVVRWGLSCRRSPILFYLLREIVLFNISSHEYSWLYVDVLLAVAIPEGGVLGLGFLDAPVHLVLPLLLQDRSLLVFRLGRAVHRLVRIQQGLLVALQQLLLALQHLSLLVLHGDLALVLA